MNLKYCAILFNVLFLIPGISFSADKLLQASDFKYLGAFRVPKSDMGGPQYQGLAYGGSVIAYNSLNNSLFIVGHDWNQQVAEIGIPEIVNSPEISNLKTASVLQNLVDITEGNLCKISATFTDITNGCKIGGLLVYNHELLGTSYAYYDGSGKAVQSHFTSGLTLADKGDFKGMFQVGTKPIPVQQAGFVAGYMTPIPSEWQSALNGEALTGMSTLGILSRTSSGPAAYSFYPNQLGDTPAPATALLNYPIEHQTIGTYGTARTLYNIGSHQSGVVFPPGTRSIIFTGQQGLGENCYGPGTTIMAEHGNRYNNPAPKNTCMGKPMTDTADPCCYDPGKLEKGGHAYPYSDYVWAYDAEDLVRVKKGGRIIDDPSPNLVDGISPTSTERYKPWDIKPYANWGLKFPYPQQGYSIFGGASAYDDATKRLYIVQVQTDGNFPVIHVYTVNTSP